MPQLYKTVTKTWCVKQGQTSWTTKCWRQWRRCPSNRSSRARFKARWQSQTRKTCRPSTNTIESTRQATRRIVAKSHKRKASCTPRALLWARLFSRQSLAFHSQLSHLNRARFTLWTNRQNRRRPLQWITKAARLKVIWCKSSSKSSNYQTRQRF